MRHLALTFAIFVLQGCGNDPTLPKREFVPEMVDSVPYDTFSKNPNTRDGKTLMQPADGTIPRGYFPFHYGTGGAEAERAGKELTNPFTSTPEVLARGEWTFQTFCTPCHGKGGLGDGPIIGRFSTPPSLVAPHAVTMPDGRIFHVITKGQGVMPAHGTQVAPDDRWKLIVWLRTLQGPSAPAASASASASASAPESAPAPASASASAPAILNEGAKP